VVVVDLKRFLRRADTFEEFVKNAPITLETWQIYTQHLASSRSPRRCWGLFGCWTEYEFSQIILFCVAVVMFGYIGYAMFKPEKF